MTTQRQDSLNTPNPVVYLSPEDAHRRFKELMNRMPFHHSFETFFNVESLDSMWKNTTLAEFPGAGNVNDPYRYIMAIKHAVRDGASTILYWSIIEVKAYRTGYTYRVVILSPNNFPLVNTAEQAILAVAQIPFGQDPRQLSEFQFTESRPPYRWRFRYDGMHLAPSFSNLKLAKRFDNLADAIEKRCTPA